MRFGNDSTLFGTEKEEGKLDAILSAVYQTAFGQDVYLVKDHPFMMDVRELRLHYF